MKNAMMRNLMITVASTIMAVAAMTVTAATVTHANEVKYVTNSEGLNVRQGAGTEYDRIGGVYQGDALDVIDYVGEWARVNFNGKIGFVKSSCLSSDKAAVAQSTQNTAVSSTAVDAYGFKANANTWNKTTYTVKVASGYLALRSSQSSDPSNITAELYNGETVEVINGSGQFWYVYARGGSLAGFVNSNYLV